MLETKIENLTSAIAKLTALFEKSNGTITQVSGPAITPNTTKTGTAAVINAAADLVYQTVPVAEVMVPIVPEPAVTVSMPAPPSFLAATPAPTAVPFTDQKGMVNWMVGMHGTLGANGDKMQGVMEALGYVNINDVTPEHYAALYQGIEALRV